MKQSIKISLIIIALALLALVVCLVWLASRTDEPFNESVSGTSGGPAFEVRVEKPRMDRFLFGILPTNIEAKLLGGELRFDHASRGSKIGSVGQDHLELSADGWDLLIEPKARIFCKPNDPPRSVFSFGFGKAFHLLFINQRHASNLVHHFRQLWHTAPSRFAGLAAFFLFYINVLRRKAFGNSGSSSEPALIETGASKTHDLR